MFLFLTTVFFIAYFIMNIIRHVFTQYSSAAVNEASCDFASFLCNYKASFTRMVITQVTTCPADVWSSWTVYLRMTCV